MGAPSKRAKKIRAASEFDLRRLALALAPPKVNTGVFSWSLDEIFTAREQQMLGRFRLPARMAESMRTDDALAVAYENRLAPQRCLPVTLVAQAGRGEAISLEAAALFGQGGVAIHPDTIADIHGCFVDHGVAVGVVTQIPRADGSRVDCELKYWPIEFVRWDPVLQCLRALTSLGNEETIVHGDGRWVVFRKHEYEPWKQEAAILPGCIVWARHALACRDWAKGSVAHGNAKVVGELPAGLTLQTGEDGALTGEAAAYLELLVAIASGDTPIGIRPAGSKVDFLTNTSTAWQVWQELVLNGEKAAARIYLGTDGILGAQGGAPGVDISELFGVATTKVEGDLKCIERGVDTGVIEPWCAINFGDSKLAPKRRYLIPDADEDRRHASVATRKQAFYADIAAARQNGFAITEEFVNRTAKEHGVAAPTLVLQPSTAAPAASAPAAAPAASAPAAAPAAPPPAKLHLVPTPPPASSPTEIEKAEHASRMNLAFIADIREAHALGLRYSQEQINEIAKRYGVPAPKLDAK